MLSKSSFGIKYTLSGTSKGSVISLYIAKTITNKKEILNMDITGGTMNSGGCFTPQNNLKSKKPIYDPSQHRWM